jgi:hypothetical protein
MDEKEEKEILKEIRTSNRLPYSIEIISVEGDVYTVRNNWGNTITYYKKGDKYLLKDDLS